MSVEDSPTSNKQILTLSDGTKVLCLYIGRIPRDTKVEDLEGVFSEFGTIKSIFLNPPGNRYTTFGFITFSTPEEAFVAYTNRFLISVLKNEGNFKLRKKLIVSPADSWHQPYESPDGTFRNFNKGCSKSRGQCLMDLLQGLMKSSREKDCTEDEEDGNCADTNNPIFKLNEDCFNHILEFIPFGDRHVVGHVCRQWRNFMSLYWSKFTVLDFSVKPFDSVVFSNQRLFLYLRLCPNIKSVYLEGKIQTKLRFRDAASSDSVITTARLCPNVQELHLSGVNLENRSLSHIYHLCKNLRVLSLDGCKFNRGDEKMLFLVRKNMLTSLQLANCEFKPSTWLAGLNSNIKRLTMLDCKFNFNYFVQGLKKLEHSLEELEVSLNSSLDLGIFNNFTNLESLSFMNTKDSLFGSLINSPLLVTVGSYRFEHLKVLVLISANFINDQLLEQIVKHSPNLTTLNISKIKNPSMTGLGFKVLGDLKFLVELYLSYNAVEDGALVAIAEGAKNLEIIGLDFCHQITDGGCKSIVQNLPKLKELNIESSNQITLKTVQAAVEAAKLNICKEELQIFARGTSIEEDATLNIHDRVTVLYNFWITCSKSKRVLKYFFDCGEDEDDDDSDDDNYDIDDDDFDFDNSDDVLDLDDDFDHHEIDLIDFFFI